MSNRPSVTGDDGHLPPSSNPAGAAATAGNAGESWRQGYWLAKLCAQELVAGDRRGLPLGHTAIFERQPGSNMVWTSGLSELQGVAIQVPEDAKGSLAVSGCAELAPVCLWQTKLSCAAQWRPQSLELDLADLFDLQSEASRRGLAAAGPRRPLGHADAEAGFVATPVVDGERRRVRFQLLMHAKCAGPAIVELHLVGKDGGDATSGGSRSAGRPWLRFQIQLNCTASLEPSAELQQLLHERLRHIPLAVAQWEFELPDRLPREPRLRLLIRPLTANESLLDDQDAQLAPLIETATGVYFAERKRDGLGFGLGESKTQYGLALTWSAQRDRIEQVFHRVQPLAATLAKAVPDPDAVAKALENLEKSIRRGTDTPCLNAQLGPEMDAYFHRTVQNAERDSQALRPRRRKKPNDDEETGQATGARVRLVPLDEQSVAADDEMAKVLAAAAHRDLLRVALSLLTDAADTVWHRAAWVQRYFGWCDELTPEEVVERPFDRWPAVMPFAEVARRVGQSEVAVRAAVNRTDHELVRLLVERGLLSGRGPWKGLDQSKRSPE